MSMHEGRVRGLIQLINRSSKRAGTVAARASGASRASGCTALLMLAILAASLARAGEAPARADRPAQADVTTVKVVQTTSDLSQRLTRLPDKRFSSRAVRRARVIHVDEHRRYQRVAGFGAAMTDTAAWLLYDQLSPKERMTVMSRLFGVEGIRLAFVRLPVGASDFTHDGTPYS
jgi:hypothetical protein